MIGIFSLIIMTVIRLIIVYPATTRSFIFGYILLPVIQEVVIIGGFFNKILSNEHMIQTQIISRGIRNPFVIEAFRKVDRIHFVPDHLADSAYSDHPLTLEEGQTISQPYMVAIMTELLALNKDDKVLEVGTGSGYQTAILACLAKEVYTIEILPSLQKKAVDTLEKLGFDNVKYLNDNGYKGWQENAPYNAILVTAAPNHIPAALTEQLAVGGRLVLPVGEKHSIQELIRIIKTENEYFTEKHGPVAFVPMVNRDLKLEG